MKKIISILIILLMIPIAIAQETENVGTLPDSPFYGLKIAMEKINLALTFDRAAKAEKRLLQAQTRLQEVEIMIEQNKLDAAEKAQKNHQKLLEKLEKIEVTDPEKAAKIQEKIEKYEQKLEEFKAKIQQKVEKKEENKERLEEMIGKITEESNIAREKAIASITKNIEKLESANKSGNAVQALIKVREKLEEKQLLGGTCGTLSPDSRNECCIKKGYEKWDTEKNKCTGEKVKKQEKAQIKVKQEKQKNEELTITNAENKVTEDSVKEETETPSESNSQFYVYYSFGVGNKNIFDTKNNLYTKDMVCDPSKEYDFKLTESEKKKIYNSVLENDLFNIKNEFTKNCDSRGCQEVTPLSTATLKITLDGKIKTIKWSANYIETTGQDLKKFESVTNVIKDIISQKEKEMGIEQPKCGYL